MTRPGPRPTRPARAALVVLLALVGAACSSGPGRATPSVDGTGDPATTALVPAPAGFRSVTVVVRTPDGRTLRRCLLVADTPAGREQGLMGVSDPGLGGFDGMEFVFEGDTRSGFWMKDTLVPLSIAFVDQTGTVVDTTDMVPCPAGTPSCPVYSAHQPYRRAVEVPAGALLDVGLVDGAKLDSGDGVACAPRSPGPT